jgi:hypothetical protein
MMGFWRRRRRKPKIGACVFLVPAERRNDWFAALDGLGAQLNRESDPRRDSDPEGFQRWIVHVARGEQKVIVSSVWMAEHGFGVQLSFEPVYENLSLAKDVEAAFVREGWQALFDLSWIPEPDAAS